MTTATGAQSRIFKPGEEVWSSGERTTGRTISRKITAYIKTAILPHQTRHIPEDVVVAANLSNIPSGLNCFVIDFTGLVVLSVFILCV